VDQDLAVVLEQAVRRLDLLLGPGDLLSSESKKSSSGSGMIDRIVTANPGNPPTMSATYSRPLRAFRFVQSDQEVPVLRRLLFFVPWLRASSDCIKTTAVLNADLIMICAESSRFINPHSHSAFRNSLTVRSSCSLASPRSSNNSPWSRSKLSAPTEKCSSTRFRDSGCKGRSFQVGNAVVEHKYHIVGSQPLQDVGLANEQTVRGHVAAAGDEHKMFPSRRDRRRTCSRRGDS